MRVKDDVRNDVRSEVGEGEDHTGGRGGGVRDAPVKPASLSAETVRRTCSIHGLKQHIRVGQSFCGSYHKFFYYQWENLFHFFFDEDNATR